MTDRTNAESPTTTAGAPGAPEELRARYAELRNRWPAMAAAVRTILADQPTPRLVRATARRISNEVLATADDMARRLEREKGEE